MINQMLVIVFFSNAIENASDSSIEVLYDVYCSEHLLSIFSCDSSSIPDNVFWSVGLSVGLSVGVNEFF